MFRGIDQYLDSCTCWPVGQFECLTMSFDVRHYSALSSKYEWKSEALIFTLWKVSVYLNNFLVVDMISTNSVNLMLYVIFNIPFRTDYGIVDGHGWNMLIIHSARNSFGLTKPYLAEVCIEHSYRLNTEGSIPQIFSPLILTTKEKSLNFSNSWYVLIIYLSDFVDFVNN